MRVRKRPIEHKKELLAAALIIARTVGYDRVTRDALATAHGCSPALVSYYFATMPQLKRAIMSAAIAERDLVVLAQGLAAKDSKALAAPAALKGAAIRALRA